ncbi:uncharacterized protein LOC123306742 [Coccinella septempunctata]|uniref:uncharacterized protein LOC123306742 n=1 Tax=Coccinella septempunctata TaxID=41139 RepID=UPI001D06987B|nr:uncharacterized protein LOC123306742 [Coccinella septempunctata]
MTLFKFPFIRRIIRRHTKPIEEDTAALWKKRLAVGYMLLAWNAFGFVCYQMYQGKLDWAAYHGLKSEEELRMTPAQSWSRAAGIKKAEVYKVRGFNVSKYEINEEENEK